MPMVCRCGRDYFPHCPECGSKAKYPVTKNNGYYEVEGQQFVSKGFRCRLCGHYYNEVDAVAECVAPSPAKPTKHGFAPAGRAGLPASVVLTPDEAKAEILKGLRLYDSQKKSQPVASAEPVTGKIVVEDLAENYRDSLDDWRPE